MELTTQFPLNIRKNDNVPMACFHFNEFTFIFIKNKFNYTTIVRGMQQKTIKGLEYDFLSFDNIHERLFAIKNGKIWEIDLISINNLFSYPGILNSANIQLKFIQNINVTSKVSIMNDHLFIFNPNNISICLIYSKCNPQIIKLPTLKPFNLFLAPSKSIIESPTFPFHWIIIAFFLNIPAFLLSYHLYNKYRNYLPVPQTIPLNINRRTEIFTSV
jgi:hypothetical protein